MVQILPTVVIHVPGIFSNNTAFHSLSFVYLYSSGSDKHDSEQDSSDSDAGSFSEGRSKSSRDDASSADSPVNSKQDKLEVENTFSDSQDCSQKPRSSIRDILRVSFGFKSFVAWSIIDVSSFHIFMILKLFLTMLPF